MILFSLYFNKHIKHTKLQELRNTVDSTGWYDNIGDRAGGCSSNPNNGTFASHNLNGCPLDIMTSDQMAKPHAVIGTWDYINGTISGKIIFSDYGNFTLKIPNKTAFGEYQLQGSWGQDGGHNLLTLCYPDAACLNNTLTAITPNHIEFTLYASLVTGHSAW
jgi:hypothetical protein